jgi:hypothetical protein
LLLGDLEYRFARSLGLAAGLATLDVAMVQANCADGPGSDNRQ